MQSQAERRGALADGTCAFVMIQACVAFDQLSKKGHGIVHLMAEPTYLKPRP
jgi:hypothetical protein